MQNSKTRFFKHYKNKPYKYLGVVRHSETLEEMALYETLYANDLGKLWVRPKDMFFEDVEINGVKRARFEKINFTFNSSEKISQKELQAVRELYQVSFGKSFPEKYETKLKSDRKFLFLMAFDGQQLVAFKFGYADSPELFYSWLGATHPSFANLGLASELMHLQHQWCGGQGFKKIKTHTRNHFLSMIKLNLQFGFKIVSTFNKSAEDIKLVLEKNLEG